MENTTIITKEEAVDRLFDDDLNLIISGNQQGDNQYLYELITCGFKGLNNYSKKALVKELYERFNTYYTIKK